MKQAMVRLSRLINTEVNPVRIKRDSFTQAQLKEWTARSKSEYDNICLHLLDISVTVTEEKNIAGFFRRQQSALTILLNNVYGYKTQYPHSPLSALYDTLTGHLENLIDEIQYHYKRYFNHDERVPVIFQQKAAEQLRRDLAVLQPLMALHDIEPDLSALALKPVEDMIYERKPAILTYRMHAYVACLMVELGKWASSTHEDARQELLSRLIYLNLNSRRLRAYCLKCLRRDTCHIPDSRKRLYTLQEYYNWYHIQPVNAGFSYNAKMSTLKQDMERWLSLEIKLLNNKMLLPGHEVLHPVGKIKRALVKLKSPFTVIQLGFWAHVQMELGKIQNTSEIEVFRIIADTHETEYQKEISADSMQKNYRQIDRKGMDELMTYAMAIYNYLKWFKSTLNK